MITKKLLITLAFLPALFSTPTHAWSLASLWPSYSQEHKQTSITSLCVGFGIGSLFAGIGAYYLVQNKWQEKLRAKEAECKQQIQAAHDWTDTSTTERLGNFRARHKKIVQELNKKHAAELAQLRANAKLSEAPRNEADDSRMQQETMHIQAQFRLLENQNRELRMRIQASAAEKAKSHTFQYSPHQRRLKATIEQINAAQKVLLSADNNKIMRFEITDKDAEAFAAVADYQEEQAYQLQQSVINKHGFFAANLYTLFSQVRVTNALNLQRLATYTMQELDKVGKK